MNDVTFCIWRSKNDSKWNKGNVVVPADCENEDDGQDFLLVYIYEDPKEWLDWAKYYYNKEFSIEYIRNIYEHKEITKEIIQSINLERDVDSVMDELREIGYI